MEKHICLICKKIFFDYLSNHRKFCSDKCRGISCSRNQKGKQHPAYGTHLSDKTKKAISKFNKGRFAMSEHPNWKGGKIVCRGYVLIKVPSGKYVCEHRLVMEKKIGRYLKKEERIHHINGNRADNRPKNLALFASESKHQHLAHKKHKFKRRIRVLAIAC